MTRKLNGIIRIMADRQDIDIAVYDSSFLAGCVEKRIREHCSSNPNAYTGIIEERDSGASALMRALTVSYREFFRDPMAWALLRKMVLP